MVLYSFTIALCAHADFSQNLKRSGNIRTQTLLLPSRIFYMMRKLELNIMSHLNQTMESKQHFLIQNDIREDQEKKTYLVEYVRARIQL